MKGRKRGWKKRSHKKQWVKKGDQLEAEQRQWVAHLMEEATNLSIRDCI